MAVVASALWCAHSSSFAMAQTDTWIDGSGDWSNSANWSAGVPGSGAVASISDADGVSRTVAYDYTGSPVSLSNLIVDLSGGAAGATNTLSISTNNLTSDGEVIGKFGSGTVNQTGGTNTINVSGYLGDDSGSSGTYNLSGGGILAANGNFFIDNGTFSQSGGTFTLPNTTMGVTLVVGQANGSGIYDLSGGSLSSDAEYIGDRGNGNFVQTGGTNIVTSTSLQYVEFAVGSNSGPTTGNYTLSGTGSLTSVNETIYPTGTFTQNGGTNTITSPSSVGAEFDIGNYGQPGGAYNLNGGILSADEMTDNGVFTQSGGQATLSAIEGNKVTLTGGTLTLVTNGYTGPKSRLQSFNLSGTGMLNLYLGGDSQGVNYDWVESSGTMSLGGTLDLDLTSGFVPNVGDQFTVMSLTSGSISGQFSELTSDDPGLTYTVNYGPSDNIVEVTITSVPEPATLTGFVLASFLVLRRRRGVVA